MESRNFSIYGLHDGSGIIKYVGKTTTTLSKRLSAHRQVARRTPLNRMRTPLYVWMRECGPESIQISLIDTANSHEELGIKETIEISKSDNLLNVQRGGYSRPYRKTKEPREYCLSGLHKFTPENEMWYGGSRRCRECYLRVQAARPKRIPKGPRTDPNWLSHNSSLSLEEISNVVKRVKAGEKGSAIAAEYGVHPNTIYYRMKLDREKELRVRGE